eukprot:11140104-Ditylum_brightwellii.AAC.1
MDPKEKRCRDNDFSSLNDNQARKRQVQSSSKRTTVVDIVSIKVVHESANTTLAKRSSTPSL